MWKMAESLRARALRVRACSSSSVSAYLRTYATHALKAAVRKSIAKGVSGLERGILVLRVYDTKSVASVAVLSSESMTPQATGV